MQEEFVINQALIDAARRHLPHFQWTQASSAPGAQHGRWIRRGRQIVLMGA
jgi:hypothetical protein